MTQVTRKNVAYGFTGPLINVGPEPIVAKRAPTAQDFADIGQLWIYTTANDVYILSSIVGGVPNWAVLTGGGGMFDHLTVTNALTDVNGPISLTSTVNTANSITITENAGTTATILISSQQSTSANAILMEALAGGVVISADLALQLESGATGTALTSTGTVFIQSNGQIDLQGHAVIAAGATVVNNTYMGQAVFTGLTTAATASQALTITNNKILANSMIMATVFVSGAEDADLVINSIVPAAGSVVITVKNLGAAAVASNVNVTYIVLTV